MDVNVRFTGIDAFEFTDEVAIFDLLGMPLVHGWLVDPQVSLLRHLLTFYLKCTRLDPNVCQCNNKLKHPPRSAQPARFGPEPV